jgi:hypothetical protein
VEHRTQAKTHHIKQTIEEVGQIIQHIDVRHRIEDRDPSYQQLTNVGLGAANVLL